jgi:hypothetical protein
MSSINLSLAAGDAAADFDDETLAEVGEAAEEEVMMTVHKHIRCDLGVPSCGGAFTPSTRLVSISQ